MIVVKVLRHKVYQDQFGVITDGIDGNRYEICQCALPQLLAETATMELFKKYWGNHCQNVLEQLEDYDLVEYALEERRVQA